MCRHLFVLSFLWFVSHNSTKDCIVEKSDGKTIHLRQKAVEAVLNGAKLVEVSELFGMSIRTVQRWLKMWSETGDYRPKQNY